MGWRTEKALFILKPFIDYAIYSHIPEKVLEVKGKQFLVILLNIY